MTAHWRDQAACRDHDGEMWFSNDASITDIARGLCVTCPVRNDCLREAIRVGADEGMWGGLRPDERAGLGVSEITDDFTMKTCGKYEGTPSGARRHYRAGEERCIQCADADRARRREQKRKRVARDAIKRQMVRAANGTFAYEMETA